MKQKAPEQSSLFDDQPVPSDRVTRTHPVAQDSRKVPEQSVSTQARSESQDAPSTWADSLAYLMSWGH